MKKKNLFDLPKKLPLASESELFELLFEQKKAANIRIERIISTGQSSPTDGGWYDQNSDEWVILLEGTAELAFFGTKENVTLQKGDYLHIPAHCRHKVLYTSSQPACIWLAIHIE